MSAGPGEAPGPGEDPALDALRLAWGDYSITGSGGLYYAIRKDGTGAPMSGTSGTLNAQIRAEMRGVTP